MTEKYFLQAQDFLTRPDDGDNGDRVNSVEEQKGNEQIVHFVTLKMAEMAKKRLKTHLILKGLTGTGLV